MKAKAIRHADKLLKEAYALLRAAAVGTNIVGDAGEWCLRAAAHSAGGRYAGADRRACGQGDVGQRTNEE